VGAHKPQLIHLWLKTTQLVRLYFSYLGAQICQIYRSIEVPKAQQALALTAHTVSVARKYRSRCAHKDPANLPVPRLHEHSQECAHLKRIPDRSFQSRTPEKCNTVHQELVEKPAETRIGLLAI
jgi:hypothetical protein